MPSDPTTAAELHALVSQWPEEAMPGLLYYSPPHSELGGIGCWFSPCNPNATNIPHAIDLHLASGLRWLIDRGFFVECWKENVGGFRVYITKLQSGCVDGEFDAPTLFLALHAAILAAKENA